MDIGAYKLVAGPKCAKKQRANEIGHRGAESNWTSFRGKEAKSWWNLSQSVTLYAGSACYMRASRLWEWREQDGGQTRVSTPSRLTLTLFNKKCICLSEGGWKPGLRVWTDYLQGQQSQTLFCLFPFATPEPWESENSHRFIGNKKWRR